MFAAQPDGSNPIDHFELAIRQANPDGTLGDGLVVLAFDNNAGCNIFFGYVGQYGICNNRPTIGQILADAGLPPEVVGPLAPVLGPLGDAMGDGNGPLIPGTPTALPYQPVPFLPTIPFLILP